MKYFKEKIIKDWGYYDFANSSYVLIFQSFLLPVFFTKNIDSDFINGSWGIANGISTLIGVILAIIVGSYSDRNAKIKSFNVLIWVTFVAITFVSLSLDFPKMVFYTYILANALFISTISLSDSLLTFISNEKNANESSGAAWGWGYLGGIICLLCVFLLQKYFGEYSHVVFLFVASYYLIFALFAIKGLKKSKIIFAEDRESLSKIDSTNKPDISRIAKLKMLSGYWLISESITIIILFFSLFASQELHLSTMNIGVIFLIVQLIGIFSTRYGGILADKFGSIKLLGFSIIGWLIVISLLITTSFFDSEIQIVSLAIITIITGLVIGNSQSFLRAQFSLLTNKIDSGFQFGLFSVSSQAAVIIGPIIHGLMTDYFNSQKIPLLITMVFMAIGFYIINITFRKYHKGI